MKEYRNSLNDPSISKDDSSVVVPLIPVNAEDSPKYRSKMQKSNIFSYIHLFFTLSTFRKANKRAREDRILDEKDIPNLGYDERSEQIANRISTIYSKKKKDSKKATLSSAAYQAFRGKMTLAFFLDAIYKSLRVSLVWISYNLLEVITNKDAVLETCLMWIGITAGVLVLASYIEQHWMFTATQVGIRIKAGLIKMVYDKLTRISVHSLNQLSIGKIVNVVANDVNIFERRMCFYTTVYLGLPTLVGGVTVLWNFYHWASLIGIAYSILTIPVQIALVKASNKPAAEKSAATDERVKLTAELIESIRLLKMYTWEKLFCDKIKELRNKEISILQRMASFEGVARGFALSGTAIASYLTFLVYVLLLNGQLSISTVFPTFFIMGFLRINVILYFLNGMSFITETGAIFQRVTEVLEAPEIDAKSFKEPAHPENAVEFDDFTGFWSKPVESDSSEESQAVVAPTPAISNIKLEIKKGSMNAIIGSVGSGKSSLLLSFTGEMPHTTGELYYSGTIAYAQQEPAIFPGTLRENVLFGKPYDQAFYTKVVKSCCLQNDFQQFPYGDLTEIGEKGVNLSGGQKARVALARAIYSRADIYLLDDPLSAVDTKVAKRIYEDAICGMLGGKTVLLVTHQVHFIKELENICVMNEGKVVGYGNYNALVHQNIDVEGIFNFDRHKSSRASLANVSLLASPGLRPSNDHASITGLSTSILGVAHNKSLEDEDIEEEAARTGSEDLEDEKGKLINAEDHNSGKVTGSTWAEYMGAMGNKCLLLICSFVFFGAVLVDLSFARLIGLWAKGGLERDQALLIIGLVTLTVLVAYIVKSVVFANIMLKGARNLHHKMIDKLITNPVEFFDTNPVGRILNRFSSDIGILDKGIPIPLEDVLTISFAFVGVIAAIGYITPQALGPVAFGALIILLITRFCSEGIRQTKIVDLASRSPLYSLFSTTLEGLISIRSYNQGQEFQHNFGDLLDINLKANVATTCNSQFLGIMVDLFYTFVSIGTIVMLLFFRNEDKSLVGFTLSFILILNGMLQYNLRALVQTDVLMASTARIVSYCYTPSEAPVIQPQDKKLKQEKWPQQGAIEFKNVCMRYRKNTDLVIKGLDFQVKPGEKIGCVGRTGAGKSSIIQLLFRMVEAEKTSPINEPTYIKIDNVDTNDIGLYLLRNKISIIPQIPVVFSGTIKRNLDPLDEHTEAELWNVLEEVRLKEYVEHLPDQLYADMTHASSIFSAGQKQLICLARAILKNSKIVVLDEATANVDSQTDVFIQQKIMERFRDCTVFTIAHRLSTIANYDKVLVLDKGKVAEFDAPYKLLVVNEGDNSITNKSGHFASMVMNTGAKASLNIFKKAKAKYEKQAGSMHV